MSNPLRLICAYLFKFWPLLIEILAPPLLIYYITIHYQQLRSMSMEQNKILFLTLTKGAMQQCFTRVGQMGHCHVKLVQKTCWVYGEDVFLDKKKMLLGNNKKKKTKSIIQFFPFLSMTLLLFSSTSMSWLFKQNITCMHY